MSNKGQFTSENQPKRGRGKSERTKILEAMKQQGRSEDDFYALLVERAFNPKDSFGFTEMLRRISPIPKAVAPTIEFEFDPKAKPHEKADQVLDAIATGKIPPDIGQGFIQSIRNMVDIEEYTDLKDRIEAIERKLGVE